MDVLVRAIPPPGEHGREEGPSWRRPALRQISPDRLPDLRRGRETGDPNRSRGACLLAAPRDLPTLVRQSGWEGEAPGTPGRQSMGCEASRERRSAPGDEANEPLHLQLRLPELLACHEVHLHLHLRPATL